MVTVALPLSGAASALFGHRKKFLDPNSISFSFLSKPPPDCSSLSILIPLELIIQTILFKQTPDVIDLRKQQRKEPEKPLYQWRSNAHMVGKMKCPHVDVAACGHLMIKMKCPHVDVAACGHLMINLYYCGETFNNQAFLPWWKRNYSLPTNSNPIIPAVDATWSASRSVQSTTKSA
ncbi:ATPase [Forsythia ovata]|uniref:ATPase n=1 Tax=Forsythia ovata TaxID=205694 RepID=A0ABD1U6J1_9LAMI